MLDHKDTRKWKWFLSGAPAQSSPSGTLQKGVVIQPIFTSYLDSTSEFIFGVGVAYGEQ